MTLQREQAHSVRQKQSGSSAAAVKLTQVKALSPVATVQQPNREHEGYLIKELQHLLRSRVETRIRAKGLWLSFPHSMVLMTLTEQPGLSGAQLARLCGVTAQTMNGLLQPLEAKKLITRAPDPENARVLKSVLTAKGRQMLQRGMQEAGAVFEQMLGSLSTRERADFRHLLRRCIDALSAPAAVNTATTQRRRAATKPVPSKSAGTKSVGTRSPRGKSVDLHAS